ERPACSGSVKDDAYDRNKSGHDAEEGTFAAAAPRGSWLRFSRPSTPCSPRFSEGRRVVTAAQRAAIMPQPPAEAAVAQGHLRARCDQTEAHRALNSILKHDLVRKVCNFSGSCTRTSDALTRGATALAIAPDARRLSCACCDGDEPQAPPTLPPR